MELNDWLEREAGLSGRKLEVAIKQCSDGMIEQVSDLMELWKGGELERTFPQSLLHGKVRNYLR